MPEESIENITKSDSNFAPTFVDHNVLLDMNFNEQCLIKENISISKKVINLYISYTRSSIKKFKHRFYISNCLFGSIKLTKDSELEINTSILDTSYDLNLVQSFIYRWKLWKKCHYFWS